MSKKLFVAMGLLIALSTVAVIGSMTLPTANEPLPELESPTEHEIEETEATVKNEYMESNEIVETEHTSSTSAMTLEDIKDKYENKFEILESEALVEVQKLVDIAISDIQVYMEDGKMPSIIELYSTYYRGGTELLDEIDSRFETKYNNLTEELTENGFDPNEAVFFQEIFNETKRNYLVELVDSLMEEI
ncbi:MULTISPECIES: hypothetical protein [Bacillaceae]|uniref:Uncharacterized protein n=1 Tax=Evansella alkalicola TaxID=745819 RepID=A0ABS6JSI8_9BACI|nr:MULTISPECIES: hypothetical protein [Bacillaceae]MBU9721535.1 hypothetical protein [Bacillus alkalicola]